MSSDAIKNALREATSIRPIKLATGGEVPTLPAYAKPATIDYSKPDDLGMFSHGAVVASKMPLAKGTPQQIKGYLTKQGVKPDEFKWSGYDEKLGGRPSVPREEVAKHFHENKPAIREHVLGGDRIMDSDDEETKYHSYTLPGGQNYREHLLTLPEIAAKTTRKQHQLFENGQIMAAGGPDAAARWRTRDPHADIREVDIPDTRAAKDNPNYAANYNSSHWDQPNVLAHLRLSDREHTTPVSGFALRNKTSGNKTRIFPTEDAAREHLKTLPEKLHANLEVVPARGADKQKLLHLEELQSDWAQDGRSKGFKQQVKRLTPEEDAELFRLHELPRDQRAPHEEKYQQLRDIARQQVVSNAGLPQAPYVDSTSKWLDLGLKRTLYEAAKGGHHKLVITPGEEQAKRYDLSQHVSHVSYHKPSDADAYHWSARDHKNEEIANGREHSFAEVSNHLGKEIADRMKNNVGREVGAPEGSGELRGLDLKVGGEGMKAFYDKMLPQALQKLAKRHDPAAEVKLHGHELLDPTYKKEPGYRVMTGGASGTPMHDSHFITRQGAERRRQEFIAQGHPADALSVETTQPSTKLHSLDITPTMRASILKGSPHFESGGAVPGYASGGAVNHAPTEAQKAAGNYRKKHISFQGLNIAIENEKGSIRRGKSASGREWRCVLPCDYGYIKGTVGADKDHVDCYVGPDEDSHVVFVVNQHHLGKGFDEHKALLGFKNEEDAICCYLGAFSDGSGPGRIGSIETMSLDGFKKWLHRGRTTKPVARGSIVDHAMQLVAGSR